MNSLANNGQVIPRKSLESLFQRASHYSRHMEKPDMQRVDELHAMLAPLVDKFQPTDEELLSVIATFILTISTNNGH